MSRWIVTNTSPQGPQGLHSRIYSSNCFIKMIFYFACILVLQAQTVEDCFISYAWANSASAVNAGSRRIEGALGWDGGDPRKIKAFLVEKGISCWIDCEQVGREVRR